MIKIKSMKLSPRHISIACFITRFILFFIPETSLYGLKRILYRKCGITVGSNTRICSSAKILPFGNVIIGANVWIGSEVLINCNKDSFVEIKDYVALGTRVVIVTGFHKINPYGNRIEEEEGTSSTIIIGNGACVSTMSLILPGKKVGNMSHVAAASVVTKDVPSYSRVAGVPAKVIKRFLNINVDTEV